MELIEGTVTVEDLDAFLARLDDIGEEYGVTVQAFDGRYVVDREHLRRAVELADRAIDRGENVARDRAVEILLYAAGRRQIDRALGMGVEEGETPVVVLVEGSDSADGDRTDGGTAADGERIAADAVAALLDPADTLGEYDPERVRDFFDVSETELAATEGDLPELVHERVALHEVRK